MPIFRHDRALHYFAHVPKAGGRSVEDYLRRRFGRLSMIDDGHHDRNRRSNWLRTTPQHAAVADIEVLFPTEWFASIFAVVRHPIARLVSAFNFQSTVWRQIPVGMSFAEWFDEYRALSRVYPYYYDNHLRPQVDFVPEGARIFRLEDGMDGLTEWLDEVTGSTAPDVKIPHVNASRPVQSAYYETEQLPRDALGAIAEFYAADFERFGYAPDPGRAFTLYMPTGRYPTAEERRRLRGRSLWGRRLWRQLVQRTGRPVFMF